MRWVGGVYILPFFLNILWLLVCSQSNFLRFYQRPSGILKILSNFSVLFRSFQILSDSGRFFQIPPVFLDSIWFFEILQNSLSFSQVPSDSFKLLQIPSVSLRISQILLDSLRLSRILWILIIIIFAFKFSHIASKSCKIV